MQSFQLDHRLAGDRVSIAGWLAGWARPSAPPFHAGALRLSARSRAAGGGALVLRLDLAYEGAVAPPSASGRERERGRDPSGPPAARHGIVD